MENTIPSWPSTFVTFSPGLNFPICIERKQHAPKCLAASGGAVSPSAPAIRAEASVLSVPRCSPPAPGAGSPRLTLHSLRVLVAYCVWSTGRIRKQNPNKPEPPAGSGKWFCREQSSAGIWETTAQRTPEPLPLLLP